MDNPYRAPQGQILTPTGGTNPMSWKQILFSFEGRIPRRQYWAGYGVIFLIAVILGFVLPIFHRRGSELGIVAGSLLIVFAIFVFWIGLAISVKRWHDQDKSGWWVLINLIPYIGGLISFVCNGCIRGTVGPNRFGDDPT